MSDPIPTPLPLPSDDEMVFTGLVITSRHTHDSRPGSGCVSVRGLDQKRATWHVGVDGHSLTRHVTVSRSTGHWCVTRGTFAEAFRDIYRVIHGESVEEVFGSTTPVPASEPLPGDDDAWSWPVDDAVSWHTSEGLPLTLETDFASLWENWGGIWGGDGGRLRVLAKLEELHSAAVLAQVQYDRDTGRSWAEIGADLGITRQTAYARYAHATELDS